jgi:ABC-type transporter Mla subunit MlaD
MTLPQKSESARGALERMAGQANIGLTRFSDMSGSLDKVALELGKVMDVLNQIVDVSASDVNAPMNQLVGALNVSSENAKASGERIGKLNDKLESATAASRELAGAMAADLGKPLGDHQHAVERVSEQMGRVEGQLERVARQLEILVGRQQQGGDVSAQLLARIGDVVSGLKEANIQMSALAKRGDEPLRADSKPGIFSRFGFGK